MQNSFKKLVWGVGVNDADYPIRTMVNKKRWDCPYYRCWVSMLRRCYSWDYHIMRPTYEGCSVCDDWLVFSKFRTWMLKQDWRGMCLDKDIISPRNKIYSSENCVFISSELNTLLTNHAAARGKYPQGVSWYRRNKIFGAHISIKGVKKLLGCYDNMRVASNVYITVKVKHIRQIADKQIDLRVAHGLRLHASLLEENYYEI